MLNTLVVRSAKLANIHGRYDFARELALGEIHRLLESREFAKNYTKAEWTACSMETCVTFNDLSFKKLVVCLTNGSRVDISKLVDAESMDLTCPDKDAKVTVTVNSGLITVNTLTPIGSIRGFYKHPINPEDNWLVKEHPYVIIYFLRWQLLSDIDAKAANIAYVNYSKMLKHLEKEPVV